MGDFRVTRGEGAFTLIELLVAMTVAAIFVALAIPAYSAFIGRNALAAHTNLFLSELRYARNEAITRGNIVRICRSANGGACATSGGWQQGWIVFVDDDDDGDRDDNGREPILRVHDALDGPTTIVGHQSRVADDVRFDGNGFTINNNGTIVVSSPHASTPTLVCIAMTGRSRTAKGAPPC